MMDTAAAAPILPAEDGGSSPLKKKKTAAAAQLTDVGSPRKKNKILSAAARAGIDESAIVGGKRDRRGGLTEQAMVNQWFLTHLVVKEGMRCNMAVLYDHYLIDCAKSVASAMGDIQFYREVKKRYPQGFGISDGSPLRDEVTEKKMPKKKTKKDGDGQPKMKDTLIDTFKALGNPASGMRFPQIQAALRQYYPHLKISTHPKMLLRIVTLGVRTGWIECLRGVGKSGYYRIYLEEEEQQELDKLREIQENAKLAAKSAGKKPKLDKQLPPTTDNVSTEQAEKVNGVEEQEKDIPAGGDMKKENKAPRVKREVHYRKCDISEIPHRRPTSLDDTFPLAITYMSDPKVTTYHRIKYYIAQIWPGKCQVKGFDARLEEALIQGRDWGWWNQLPSDDHPVKQSTFRLEVDEFDPHRDTKLTDCVITAIVACHEPKQCSVIQLRKYWRDFHAEYKTEQNPDRYKKALDRACAKQIIRQISGVGSTGSFQLVSKFTPDPYTLVGPGDESEEEESGSESGESSEEGERDSREEEKYAEKYVPRGTKSRGTTGASTSRAIAAADSRRKLASKKGLSKKVDVDYRPGGPRRKAKPKGKKGSRK